MNYFIDRIPEDSPLHVHRGHEIILCVAGEGVLRAGGREWRLREGSIAIVPSRMLHSCSSPSARFDRIFINGDFDSLLLPSALTVIADSASRGAFLCFQRIKKSLLLREKGDRASGG